MRKLTHSLTAKIVAVFLITITLLGTAAMAVGIAAITALGGYTGEYVHNSDAVIENILSSYAYDICVRYRNGAEPLEYYQQNNFYFTLFDADGNVLASNYTGQAAAHTITDSFTLSYQSHYYDEETQNWYERSPAEYTISMWEKAEMERTDLLSIANFWLDLGYSWRYTAIILDVCGFLLFLILLIFLYCSAGHRQGTDEIILNKIDRIPFDLYTAICTALFCIICALGMQTIDGLYDNMYDVLLTAAVIGVMLLLCFLILLAYTMSLATRLKAGGLVRQTILYKIIAFFGRGLAKLLHGILYLLRGIPLIGKTMLILILLTVVEFVFLITFWWEPNILLLFWFLEKLILIPCILLIALSMRRLQKCGENIAAGRLDQKIDTRHMLGDFKKFGETLNNINAGMGHAVEERLKTERLKTELITNVSHDIKTPLTSIINYVDLIKKEDPENETLREYVGVLDRQAARLKKLIEDLVEASKASTGNLTVQLEPCDIGVLLVQTAGEYQERLEAPRLELIITQPDVPVKILTDGRHLWRIFENLLSNICKYAQPNTRVYLTLERIGKRAVVTFRNISNYPLNISSEELMERFVRGDASRHTEGSGLGLSIAQSLSDLLGGHIDIAIDGDLFKVILSFEAIE